MSSDRPSFGEWARVIGSHELRLDVEIDGAEVEIATREAVERADRQGRLRTTT